MADEVTFETAKLLHAKGYRNGMENKYWLEAAQTSLGAALVNLLVEWADVQNYRDFAAQYAQPSQSDAQKWLRENHKVRVYVIQMGGGTFGCEVYVPNPDKSKVVAIPWKREPFCFKNFLTYEEALEEGLQQGLKTLTDAS